MLIGELARAAGVNVQTVRYYERVGLVLPDGRTSSGYRRYGPGSLLRLRRIKQAQRLGFKLAELRAIFRGGDSDAIAGVLRAAAVRKAQELQTRIDDLRAIQQRLLGELDRCACGEGAPCTFVRSLGASG
jgi:DNA-binding transcriptional MerR regulator